MGLGESVREVVSEFSPEGCSLKGWQAPQVLGMQSPFHSCFLQVSAVPLFLNDWEELTLAASVSL